MMGVIRLKPASNRDYEFALGLYLPAMKPLAEKFIVWREAEQVERFAQNWAASKTRIIFSGRRKIGWIQVDETTSEICLQQLFIAPELQRQGIGSCVLRWLVSIGSVAGKPVTLTVLSNNPARRLYRRFGFQVVGQEGVKLKLARESSPASHPYGRRDQE